MVLVAFCPLFVHTKSRPGVRGWENPGLSARNRHRAARRAADNLIFFSKDLGTAAAAAA